MNIAQASGTMTDGSVFVTDSAGRSNGCDVTSHQTRERTETATLAKFEGTFVTFSFNADGTYQLMIPHMSGPSQGTDRVSATGTETGGPECRNPDPTDETTTFTGNLSTAILTVTGVGAENARTLVGSAIVELEGSPDRRYNVSWNLSR
jgi:hypothetical protein